jgi:hypothetical protein
MSDECISPLRRRMIEDTTVRKFTLKTQSDYIRVVKNFTIFLGRSPDTASNEDLRRFQRIARPTAWLFTGQDPLQPISTRQLTRACLWPTALDFTT